MTTHDPTTAEGRAYWAERRTVEEAREVAWPRTAWDLIGWDDGAIRIVGGRATYQAVMYNCATGGRMVILARVEHVLGDDGQYHLHQACRYVEPDTLIERVTP